MISAGNNADNSGIFLLLMSTAYSIFPASHATPPERMLKVLKYLGQTKLGQLIPADPRDIPYHIEHAQHKKLWGVRRSGLQLKSCLSSQVTFTCTGGG